MISSNHNEHQLLELSRRVVIISKDQWLLEKD